MDTEDVLLLLKKKQGKRTARALAAEIGISPQYLCDIYRGKREAGDKVLAHIGIRWELTKVRK